MTTRSIRTVSIAVCAVVACHAEPPVGPAEGADADVAVPDASAFDAGEVNEGVDEGTTDAGADAGSAVDGGSLDAGVDAGFDGGLLLPLCDAEPAVERDGPDPGMKLVPAGAFWQGCYAAFDSSCGSDEVPGRCVTLDTFEIDAKEVTAGDYARYLSDIDAGWYTCPWPLGSGDPNQAATCVAVWEARDYCASEGKRLPTEAEWEKAARGTDGRVYPWGNDPPTCDLAFYASCPWTNEDAVDVGGVPAGRSPYGVEDMAGNAEEWVNDWYDATYYSYAPDQDPPGPDPADPRFEVLRGGSVVSVPAAIRTSARSYDYTNVVTTYRGFRCAKSVF